MCQLSEVNYDVYHVISEKENSPPAPILPGAPRGPAGPAGPIIEETHVKHEYTSTTESHVLWTFFG